MTHEDSGHYAAKHPADTVVPPELAAAVAANLRDGQLTCREAHRIAADQHVAPAVVGQAVDLAEIRIARCQLGLFGYQPDKKVVGPAAEVSPAVADAIRGELSGGRLSCHQAWRLAEDHQIPRMAIASACETLGIKIGPCQLGAF